jgi:hypothetical protein
MEIVVAPTNAVYSSIDGVLFNKSQTELLYYPGGRIGIYSIPAGVTDIGDSAFAACDGITSVEIPQSVTRIGNHAFMSCDTFSSVVIPDSVTTIGSVMWLYQTVLRGLRLAPSFTAQPLPVL